MRKKTIIIGILVVLLLSGIIYVGFGYFLNFQDGRKNEQNVQTTTITELNTINESVVSAPEGWLLYFSKNTNPRLAFSYPATWEVVEDERNLIISGDGYRIMIGRFGTEVSGDEWTHPKYFIGGYETWRTWESFVDGTYAQILSLRVLETDTIVIRVVTPSDSKDITDHILSSIIFLK